MMNDISQIWVVTKNEMIKSMRGKKFLVSLAIVLIVFALITLMQTIVSGGWDNIKTTSDVLSTYMTTMTIIILLVVALLSSIALVSEFEERTALILFTRPVRRTTILLGKILSCLLIEAMIILVYYVLVTAVSLIHVGSVSEHMVTSFLMAVLYAFAASGIAFVISAFFKKGSVCTIISLLVLLVVIPIVSSMIDGETWYMLDKAGDTIITCVPEYVEQANKTMDSFREVVASAAEILGGFTDEQVRASVDAINAFIQTPDFWSLDVNVQTAMLTVSGFMSNVPSEYLPGMVAVLKAMCNASILAPIENPDIAKEVLVLLVWGLVGYFIAWIRFVRREF